MPKTDELATVTPTGFHTSAADSLPEAVQRIARALKTSDFLIREIMSRFEATGLPLWTHISATGASA